MSDKKFQQPSVMSAQQHFSAVPSADIQRSKFDRSHAYKTTMDSGILTPVFVDEVLPGDTFTMSVTAFARLATPLKPFMDNLYMDIHWFFVPNRLVWDNWVYFMGERKNPTDDPAVFTLPKVTIALNRGPGYLHNYFGIPFRGSANTVSVNALPQRAYWLIYNEWYRDQNLENSEVIPMGNGPDTELRGGLPARRMKRHDYFTSCLPWPQKGSAVTIPIGVSAPVKGLGWVGLPAQTGPQASVKETGGGTVAYTNAISGQNLQVRATANPTTTGFPDIYADLTSATSISINDLRTAFQVQRLLERDARGGTRYIELILSHFGVRSPDARLQRPEFLGGSTTRVNVNPVAATVPEATVPQGNLAGIGTVVNRGGFHKSFTEHGLILGIASVRADLTYQQGIERFWSRSTRYDFYWPALAHLGEQAVLNKEIFVQGVPATDNAVFGYQERYAEYRYKPSRITGAFSSDWTSSLDVWHVSQDFAELPVLNAAFMAEDPPVDRVIAVPTEPHFLVDIWYDLKCDRPMPVYSVPGFIDQF